MPIDQLLAFNYIYLFIRRCKYLPNKSQLYKYIPPSYRTKPWNTHFSIGSFAVPWVWNPPHPLPHKVSKIITDFYEIGDSETFVRLMNSRDNNVLPWLGKFFIYGTEGTRWSSYLKSVWYLTELYKALCIYLWLPQTTDRVTWWALGLLILVSTPEMSYNDTNLI